jgi:hypothetical protein
MGDPNDKTVYIPEANQCRSHLPNVSPNRERYNFARFDGILMQKPVTLQYFSLLHIKTTMLNSTLHHKV